MGKLIFSTLSIGHLASGWIQVFENSNIFTPEWKQSQGGKGKIFFPESDLSFKKKSVENLFPLSISIAALQLWPRWRLGELQAPVQHLRVADLHPAKHISGSPGSIKA